MRDESTVHCHPERSEGSHALSNEILRFAQDDKLVLSIPAAFWPPFLGLLNEYVGVNLQASQPQRTVDSWVLFPKISLIAIHLRKHRILENNTVQLDEQSYNIYLKEVYVVDRSQRFCW